MALELSELQVKGLQDPSYYEQIIKSDYLIEGFEGPLAACVVQVNSGQHEEGVKALTELCSQGVSLAFFVLIRHHLKEH